MTPNEFDLLAAELAPFYTKATATKLAMAKAMSASSYEPKRGVLIQPLSSLKRAIKPDSKPQTPASTNPAKDRRRAMIAAADRTEVMAKAFADCGRITMVEHRFIKQQISQLRHDAAGIR